MGRSLVVLEHAGRGGNWWSAVGWAVGMKLAGVDVTMIAPPDHEQLFPDSVPITVVPTLRWDDRSWWGIQRSFLSNELTMRRYVKRTTDACLVPFQQFSLARGGNVVQFVHNPEPRPIRGSMRAAVVKHRLMVGGAKNRARHGETFHVTADGWLEWPHPLLPASFQGLPAEFEQIFPGAHQAPRDTVRLLAFGRAARPEGLSVIGQWLSELTAEVRSRFTLFVSGSDEASGQIKVAVPDTLVVQGGRIPSQLLDSVIQQVDAVCVPHETNPRSVSGLAVLATANQTPIVTGSAVNLALIDGGPKAIGLGATGLERLRPGARKEQVASAHLDGLRTWGCQLAEMLANTDLLEVDV